MSTEKTSRRGFAGFTPEKLKEVSRKGGEAAHEKGTAHEFTPEEAIEAGRKGGEKVSQDRAHMARIGKLGGKARHKAQTAAKGDGALAGSVSHPSRKGPEKRAWWERRGWDGRGYLPLALGLRTGHVHRGFLSYRLDWRTMGTLISLLNEGDFTRPYVWTRNSHDGIVAATRLRTGGGGYPVFVSMGRAKKTTRPRHLARAERMVRMLQDPLGAIILASGGKP